MNGEAVLAKHLGDGRSRGERIADVVVSTMGSWRFIIYQSVVVALWVALNVAVVALRFDPYPFILLNLLFSTQAAYASPLILMSGNRAAARDHDFAEHQFDEIEDIKTLLAQNTELTKQIAELSGRQA
jgi:uncharacterized membrane protein